MKVSPFIANYGLGPKTDWPEADKYDSIGSTEVY
jgi:hypothetical protein